MISRPGLVSGCVSVGDIVFVALGLSRTIVRTTVCDTVDGSMVVCIPAGVLRWLKHISRQNATNDLDDP